jgi:hypothetical protein
MTRLQELALATLPISEKDVEAFYNGQKPWNDRTFKSLCESHERLRAELQGCEALIQDDRQGQLNILEDEVDEALSMINSIPCSCSKGKQCRRCCLLKSYGRGQN